MTDRLRGLKIDNQLECGRLLDRKVGRLGATQHLDDHLRPLTIGLSETWPITYKTTLFCHVWPLVDCRQAQRRDALDDDATVGEKQGRRQNVERLGARRLGIVDRGHDLLEFGHAINRKLDAMRARGLLQRSKVTHRGDPRVGQRRYSARAGHRLHQDVLPLSVEFGREKADPRGIAARPREGLHKPRSNHVFSHTDKGYCPGCLLEGARPAVCATDDRIRRGLDDRRRAFGKPVVIRDAKATRDDDEVLPFDESRASQLIEQGDDPWRLPSMGEQETEAIDTTRLLRARRKRPRNRAAEQRDELATFHSITSSASASSLSGTWRLSALAVLRLITSSNLVDCMTGRSAGFSPLRIRPA